MSVQTWARRVSGLLVPRMSLANPLGRFQVCPPGECCECDTTDCPACPPFPGPGPPFLEVTIAGVTNGDCSDCANEINGVHILSNQSNPLACAWGLVVPLPTVCGGAKSFSVGVDPLRCRIVIQGVPFALVDFASVMDGSSCLTWNQKNAAYTGEAGADTSCVFGPGVTFKVSSIC